RLPRVDVGAVTKSAGDVQALLGKNPDVFAHDFGELDLSEVDEPRRKAAAEAFDDLRRVVRGYPGMRLGEVLADPARSTEEKARIVDRRVSLVDAVQKRVGSDELLRFDFSPDSQDVARLGLDQIAQPDERKLVVDTLKAYQRTFAIANSPERAQSLMEAGYSSAFSIARKNYEQF